MINDLYRIRLDTRTIQQSLAPKEQHSLSGATELLRVVDLFCGAGGMARGLKEAGFDVHRAYDFWEPALAIHEANLPTFLGKLNGSKRTRRRNLGVVDSSQLKTIVEESRPEKSAAALVELIEEIEAVGDIVSFIPEIVELAPDMIVGGPPCQPWSQVGPRQGDADPRAKLTIAFGTIVCTARPRYVVMENVKQIKNSKTFAQLKAMLKKSGYGLTEAVLDASYYGVAQARERLLLIGCLGECDNWLSDHLVAAKSEKPMTVADVLGPDFGAPHYRHRRRDGQVVWRAANSQTKGEKVNFFWLDPVWAGKDTASRRTDKPVKTISRSVLSKSSANYPTKPNDVEDVEVLPVPTFEQLAQLAGFPASWDWSAVPEKTTCMRILSNAVPPGLAAAVGRCILAHHGGKPALAKSDRKVPREFVSFLKREKKFEGARLSQVLSEFRAVRTLVGSRTFETYSGLLEFMETIPEFAGLSAPRKSNLRKAIRLFQEADEAQRRSAELANEQRQKSRPRRTFGRTSHVSSASIIPDIPEAQAVASRRRQVLVRG